MFYYMIKNFRKIQRSTWLAMIATFLIIMSPLIVFDLVHNFDNFLVPYRLLTGEKNELAPLTVTSIINHSNTLISTLGRIWFLKLNTNLRQVALETETASISGNIFLAMISSIALIWFIVKNRKPGYKIFLLPLIGYPLIFLLYPSYNPEYYLMSFITLLTIAIGYWLNTLPKIISYPFIIIFVIANILTVVTTTDDYGLTTRRELIKKTAPALKGKSFYLETAGPRDNPQYEYAGWRLLYKIYGQTPAQSSIDSVLGWIYSDEISKSAPSLKLVIVQDMKPKFNSKPRYKFDSGVYGAYVFKNK